MSGFCSSNSSFGGGMTRDGPHMFAVDPDDVGFLIANARLVDRDRDEPGAVFIRAGKIAAVYSGDEADRIVADIELAESGSGCGEPFYPGPPEIIDAHGAVLMPALVDLHAHFRDPGMTQKENLESASRAASAGGYATVVLMANTNPVISDEKAALDVDARVREIGLVQAFQAVSLTRNFEGADTSGLASLDALAVPVATEDGREVASAAVMLEAMNACASSGVLVSCHCEDPSLAQSAKPFREEALASARALGFLPGVLHDSDGLTPASVSAPLARAEKILRDAEDSMTIRNLQLAAEAGCRVHIAHVSTSGALDAVRSAKLSRSAGRGSSAPSSPVRERVFSVSCEVTPHHLSMTDAVPEIVNPPLRGDADRESLIRGILDGTVDAIATDHAPHTAADKAAGAPGFSGIQIAFPVCNTALVRSGRISLSKLSALMSANPSALLSLKRGLLRSGFDADLVLVDPEASVYVDTQSPGWFSLGKNTPLEGRYLFGKILSTWRAGKKVFNGGT